MNRASEQELRNRIAALEEELAAYRACGSPETAAVISTQAPIGLFITDDQGRITWVNKTWSRITGIPATRALGAEWTIGIHPDDCRRGVALWQQSAREGEHLTMDYRIITEERGTCWVHGAAAPLAGQGTVTGYIGTLVDITRQREREEASEARWQSIAEVMSENVWILDMDLRVTFISPSVTHLAGFTLGEMQGLPLERQMTDDSRMRALGTMAQLLTPERLADPHDRLETRLEMEFYRKDGSTFWSEVTYTLLRECGGKPAGILGVGRDITERKKAHAILAAAERRNALLLNALPDIAVLLFDRDHRYQIAGGTELAAAGFDASAIPGKTLREAFPPAVADHFEPYYRRALEGEENQFEVDYDGSIYHEQVLPVRDETGAVTGGMVVTRNVTAARQAERELLESERRYRELLDTSKLVAVMLDRRGRIIYCNDFLLELTGWSRDEVLNHDWFERFVPDPQVKPMFLESLAKGTIPAHFENPLVTRSGDQRFILWNNTILRDSSGAITGTSSLGLDLTDRIAADDALQRSEALLQGVIQAAPVAIGLMQNRIIRMVNDRFCEMTGYAREEVLGQPSRLLYLDDDEYERVGTEKYRQIEIDGIGSVETRWRRKDGRVITVILNSKPLFDRDLTREIAFTALDITARKTAEEELAGREKEISSILQAAPVGISVMRDRRFIMVNDSMTELTGYRREELLGQSTRLLYASDEEWHDVGEAIARQVVDLGYSSLEVTIRRSDGSPRIVYFRAQPLYADDMMREMATVVMDITQRKQYERALLESSNRQLSILDSMSDGYCTVSDDGTVTFTNRAAEEIINRERQYLIGRRLFEALPHLAGTALEEIVRRVLHDRTSIATEAPISLPDGRQWLDIRCYPITMGVALYLRVITKQKRLEEYRHTNEERMKALYELSQVDFTTENDLISHALDLGIRLTGSRYGYFHFVDHDQVNLTLGVWSHEVHGDCASDLNRHYPLSKAGIWADCARNRVPVVHNDYQNEPGRKGYPDGHVPITRHLSIPILDGDKVRGIAGVANKEEPYEDTDVYQLHLFMDGVWKIIIRRRAEEWLARELGLHMALSAISESLIAGAITIPDIASVVLDHARAMTRSVYGFVAEIEPDTSALRVHRITPARSESDGPLAFIPAADGRYPGLFGEALNRRQAYFTNDAANHPAFAGLPQEHVDIQRFLAAPAIVGDQVLGLIALANANRDYTAMELEAVQRMADLYAMAIFRIRSEQRLKHSLLEKEVLIKEVHHRVKNNLQVISSLLALQAPRVSNQADLELFEESQNRIYTMALVHEKLYQSDNLARIDFDNYIRSLAQHLVQSYSVKSSRVHIIVDVRDVVLDIDRAIPCAQIVNELVSNALKHAFPEDTEGRITIECINRGDGAYLLAVGDNGRGLPAGIVPGETGSLGLQIVSALTSQLGGSLRIERTGGTRFVIDF